jgi:hypothetical protein
MCARKKGSDMSSSGALPQSSASDSSASFERFGGYATLFAALGSLLYSVAFVILKNVVVYSVALAAGGIVTTAILTAIYFRVRETDAAFSLWALLIGIIAPFGLVVAVGAVIALRRIATLPSPD